MTLQVCEFKPFVSQVTPQDPPTSNSISLFQDEVQRYLELFRLAICADLTALETAVEALEARVDACCGSS